MAVRLPPCHPIFLNPGFRCCPRCDSPRKIECGTLECHHLSSYQLTVGALVVALLLDEDAVLAHSLDGTVDLIHFVGLVVCSGVSDEHAESALVRAVGQGPFTPKWATPITNLKRKE